MIEVSKLCKTFIAADGREVRAVDHLSLQCFPGEVFGLLGPNGAGKSTTLRILSTLLSPSSGTVRIGGFDPHTQPLEVRRRLGYVTATTGLYERLTPREILRYFGDLHGIENVRLEKRIDDLRQWLDLTEFFDRQCRTLSTGQKQRTSIARILVHDPPILILDEPTLGLDVLSNRVVLAFIAECARAGKTVVMSTHYLDDAEALCKRFCLIHQGHSIGLGTLDELRTQCAAASAGVAAPQAVPLTDATPARPMRLSEIFLQLTGGGVDAQLKALPAMAGALQPLAGAAPPSAAAVTPASTVSTADSSPVTPESPRP